jgi:predicted  nucleic acid-binding Zn-ribbon protein
MSQLKALHRLQKIDQDLDARRQRVRDIAVRLEQDDVLRQAQADVAALQSALHPPETRTADLNLEIQTIASQTGQLTNRLYSGKVNNPKELQDIQDKIAELKRRHAHLENTLLETMIAIEERNIWPR